MTPEIVVCPDCGAKNPARAELCVECGHPLETPESQAVLAKGEPISSAPPPAHGAPGGPAPPARRPQRPDRPARPTRPDPNVATWGYRPGRGGSTNVPGWLWIAVGIAALGAVLVAAVQIARQEPPLTIPNASKPQLAEAESLRTVLKRDSTQIDANVAFGNLYYDTGNFGDAIPYYQRALRKDPSLTDVRVDMGVSYNNTGNIEAAQRTLEEATRLSPNHAVAHFDLGVVYQTVGRPTDARAHFVQAKALQHPPEMDAIVDTLIARIDHPRPAGGMNLPPGHPDVSSMGGAGAAGGAAGGLPPGHPDISGGAAGTPPPGSGGGK